MIHKYSWERGVKIRERSIPADISEEGGAIGATGTQEQRFPAIRAEEGCSPAAHRSIQRRSYPHAA